jgi:undecaprenyl-diphosphatase
MSSSIAQLLAAIILGIVQGVAEWLPISSKTQIIIVSEYILGLTFQQAYAFGLFMQIGTVLAAIIYFRQEVWSLIRALVGRGSKEERRLFKFVLITTLVTGVIAVPLYLVVYKISSGYNIGLPMIVLGIILFVDALIIEYSRSKYAEDRNRKVLKDIGVRDYVLVGVAQGLAALPGVSRSGATTSTMLLLNVEVKEAFRLSFLVGIFASAAAFFVALIFSQTSVSVAVASLGTTGILVAIAVSTVVSLLLIDFLLGVAGKARIVYLIVALGIIAIVGGVLISLFPLGFNAG